MKINFLLLTFATAAITSCSSSYKTGQTPDDVYYSPPRLETNEVRRDREENNTVDNTVYTPSEDREIRRKIRHRRYRRYDDRYDYPYGYNGVYTNPKYQTPQNTSEPRKTNLGAYTPNTPATDSTVKSTNPKLGNTTNAGTTTNPSRTFQNSSNKNNGSAVGNFMRRVFSTDGSGNSNNSYNNSNNSNSSSRTFDNNRSSNNNNSSNNSNTSSGSKSSSSSAPVRTFGKQN